VNHDLAPLRLCFSGGNIFLASFHTTEYRYKKEKGLWLGELPLSPLYGAVQIIFGGLIIYCNYLIDRNLLNRRLLEKSNTSSETTAENS
jgi:hypothetical protein